MAGRTGLTLSGFKWLDRIGWILLILCLTLAIVSTVVVDVQIGEYLCNPAHFCLVFLCK